MRSLLVPSLIVVMAASGCAGGPGAADGTDGSGEAAGSGESTSIESASTHEARPKYLPQGRTGQYDRPRPAESRAEAAYSLGKAYVPAGFGEGSLWATNLVTCDDTGEAPPPGEYGDTAGSSAAACGAPANMLLKRLDPETGRVTAAVELDGFFANVTEVAFGAGSVWVSSADYYPGPVDGAGSPGDAVLRVDPATNRVVDRIPLPSPSGVAFGHGSVWVTSAGQGTLSRINPETGEVAARIEVGRGAVDVAVDERGGAVWIAGLHLPEDYEEYPPPGHSEDRKLTRVDPGTNRVVAEVPIGAGSPEGGAHSVDVGEGAVWAASVDGDLLKVDPATNEVLAITRLGDYTSDLAVSEGVVWATVQNKAPGDVRTLLVRVDPSTVKVVGSRDLGGLEASGPGRIAVGDGNVWFVTGGAKAGAGTLTRASQ